MKNSIILVPFPFDDFSFLKVRPALCLTNEIGDYQHIIIAFISSKISETLNDSDILIKINSDDWVGTGLQLDSVIKLHKMISIPKSLIKRKLGVINPSLEFIIQKKILDIFNK